jgi:hypothetical protein
MAIQWVFMSCMWTYFLVKYESIGVSQCICSQPLDPMGIHLFWCVHGEKTTISHDVMWDVFVTTTRNVRFHISQAQTPCHAIFAMLSWHYVINRWCPRVDRRCHHWPYLSWFDFAGCFFSWGCCNNHDSSKGWSLLQLVPNEHVFSSSYKSFWMFTLVGGWVFSSMCQHGLGYKGH